MLWTRNGWSPCSLESKGVVMARGTRDGLRARRASSAPPSTDAADFNREEEELNTADGGGGAGGGAHPPRGRTARRPPRPLPTNQAPSTSVAQLSYEGDNLVRVVQALSARRYTPAFLRPCAHEASTAFGAFFVQSFLFYRRVIDASSARPAVLTCCDDESHRTTDVLDVLDVGASGRPFSRGFPVHL